MEAAATFKNQFLGYLGPRRHDLWALLFVLPGPIRMPVPTSCEFAESVEVALIHTYRILGRLGSLLPRSPTPRFSHPLTRPEHPQRHLRSLIKPSKAPQHLSTNSQAALGPAITTSGASSFAFLGPAPNAHDHIPWV